MAINWQDLYRRQQQSVQQPLQQPIQGLPGPEFYQQHQQQFEGNPYLSPFAGLWPAMQSFLAPLQTGGPQMWQQFLGGIGPFLNASVAGIGPAIQNAMGSSQPGPAPQAMPSIPSTPAVPPAPQLPIAQTGWVRNWGNGGRSPVSPMPVPAGDRGNMRREG